MKSLGWCKIQNERAGHIKRLENEAGGDEQFFCDIL